jgi:M6 family metalloprotease-like protein
MLSVNGWEVLKRLFRLNLIVLTWGAFVVSIWCGLCAQVMAVPAAPVLHTLIQASGKTFQARQWGDESGHGWEAENGYTIIFNESTRCWDFAVPGEKGELIDSNVPVDSVNALDITHSRKGYTKRVIPSGLPIDLKPHLRPRPELERTMKWNDSALHLVRKASPEAGEVAPLLGEMDVPIVMINFRNTSTTNMPTEFNALLFGTGPSDFSMRQYYGEVSYGAFNVSAGINGIAGWYTSVYDHDYYGGNQSIGGGSDQHPALLAYEALQAADQQIDFRAYTLNPDCTLVLPVMVIHQGTGEEGSGVATDIWSHSWRLSWAASYDTLVPGVFVSNDACPFGGYIKIDKYTIQPERYSSGISTMGVFAHEMGHGIGLPDLYDYDYDSEGVGRWSLMGSGSWSYVARPGDRPSHLDPRSKYAMGWATPVSVGSALLERTIQPAYLAGDAYQLGLGSPMDGVGEYFLAENRQLAGFDVGLPGAGLLIWHVDEAQANNDFQCYPGGPSCLLQHYKVAVVQADNLWDLEKDRNRGDSGDPFPGTQGIFDFSDVTSPNSNWYNGTASSISITGIRQNADSTMSATFQIAQSAEASLTVFKAGSGLGKVTSSPAGIDCGNDCVEIFDVGAVVTLTAEPASGSTFSGFGGNSDCTDGVVTINAAKTCIATFSLALGEVLDNATLPFASSGDALWWGQTQTTHDGSDAAQSGPISASQASYLETTVSGPGTVGFYWKVSSEAYFDFLTFSVDGIDPIGPISGEVNWQYKSVLIPAGIHSLRWTYGKDWYLDAGLDAGWVDQVTFTPAGPSYLLSVEKTGVGSGLVTSIPSGINCGTDCSESFSDGTVVALNATPAVGSVFAGFGGDPDCADGTVTMDAIKTCSVVFTLPGPQHSLTVSKLGPGSGSVSTTPPGIDCGIDCEEAFPEGTTVALAAEANEGSIFLGWAGDQDCSDGIVQMASDRNCVAAFLEQNSSLSVRILGASTARTTGRTSNFSIYLQTRNSGTERIRIVPDLAMSGAELVTRKSGPSATAVWLKPGKTYSFKWTFKARQIGTVNFLAWVSIQGGHLSVPTSLSVTITP